MKTLFGVILVFAFCSGCNNGTETEKKFNSGICGVSDPLKDLPWLQDIINKAEQDKAHKTYQGNYMGKIYLETYKGKLVFLCDMAMGSGGIGGYVFHCDGIKEGFNNDPKEVESFFNSIKKTNIIYSNVPI
jgi:hypothetical protein